VQVLFYQPSFYAPFFLRKRYACFNRFSVVCSVGDCVVFTVNLFQGIFGSGIAVYFELENVDIADRFYYGVGSLYYSLLRFAQTAPSA
jgi:hypothetical protein